MFTIKRIHGIVAPTETHFLVSPIKEKGHRIQGVVSYFVIAEGLFDNGDVSIRSIPILDAGFHDITFWADHSTDDDIVVHWAQLERLFEMDERPSWVNKLVKKLWGDEQ